MGEFCVFYTDEFWMTFEFNTWRGVIGGGSRQFMYFGAPFNVEDVIV
jgi:hypothetical protein